jgi:asparagine synthase (glutamine-hydrolysing)
MQGEEEMCGIVAMYSTRQPIRAEALERATGRLTHRGPDGQRTWLSADHRVGLGHARLSIIDLVTGAQPIASEDEALQIVVNGEFYDFESTQRDLEARGHRLRTRTDSEIALHLYEDYRTACLRHLRGEFAFVLWDGANNTLFAARDRFGIKPLYYTTHRGTLYLASEIKALQAAGVPARWDRAAFFHANHFLGIPPGGTLFEGIRPVPPGHYLLASGGQVRLIRYWDFDYPSAAPFRDGCPDAEYGEQLRQILGEAVRLRLRADVPVGCYLSGGLDSCAVLGLAAAHRREPIRAFTLTFDRAPLHDEGAVARDMAAHAGADFQPILIRQSDLADHFADATWQAETLCINGHGVAKYLLSRAVRNAGFKVVLTGEGADEILAGYAHFRRDLLLHQRQGWGKQTIRQLLGQLQANNVVSRGTLLPEGVPPSLPSVRHTLGFVPSWLEAHATVANRLRNLFAADFAVEFAGIDPYHTFLNGLDVAGQLAGREPVNQSMYLWSKAGLPNYILAVLGDRMEMAHSVEGRVPFLDHHVVEFVRDLPTAQKIRGMTEKYVLREAARPVLSGTVYRRQKHPFAAPPAALAPSERLYELMQETLRGPVMASLPFYDRAKVIALLDGLSALNIDARADLDPVLMILLSACCLQERYLQ